MICHKKRLQRLINRGLNKARAAIKPPLLLPSQETRIVVKQAASHIEAAKSLTDKGMVKEKSTNPAKPKDYSCVHPDIVEFHEKLIAELAKRQMPFHAFELYRSPERQNRLLKHGVTKAKGGQSPHNYGMAVDLVHDKRFWDLTRTQWDVIGAIGKEVARKMGVKVTWGGDFRSFYDPAHWELEDWRKQLKDTDRIWHGLRRRHGHPKEKGKPIGISARPIPEDKVDHAFAYQTWLHSLVTPF